MIKILNKLNWLAVANRTPNVQKKNIGRNVKAPAKNVKAPVKLPTPAFPNKKLGPAVATLPGTKKKVGNTTLKVWQGDITKLQIGAIVNAADKHLTGGGGIDRVIQNAAGQNVKNLCKKLQCGLGKAVITIGGNLPARNIVHTVGPDLRNNNPKGKPTRQDKTNLKNCYISSLKLCEKNKITSVAFPCISAGTYAYPLANAARVAVEAVKEYLKATPRTCIRNVVFCTSSQRQRTTYGSAI